jgi:hypothetical protein
LLVSRTSEPDDLRIYPVLHHRRRGARPKSHRDRVRHLLGYLSGVTLCLLTTAPGKPHCW